MKTKTTRDAMKEGNECIAMGLGLGGFGAGTLLAFGATCPLCVVAAPGLIGLGLYKRLTAKGAPGAAGRDDAEDHKPEDAHGTD